MSEPPKFKTFKDLKSIPPANHGTVQLVTLPNTSNTSNTSSDIIPSITSNSSISSNTSITSKSRNNSNYGKGKLPLNTDISFNGENAVIRDFQKVPNSITRQLLAQGIFKGKSKQVWDYLWSVSRGAINPSRFVRKSRPEIKNGSGLGSFVTVDKSIKHLETVGLLKKVELTGSHNGNKFEIFTPEEALSLTSLSGNTSNASNTSYTQKVDILVLPESSNTSSTQMPINISSNKNAKTFFKDSIKPDDDNSAFSIMNEKLAGVVKKITGQKISVRDREKWGQLADLLILELEVAAARADGVSSVPAFLTEVLRRQFFNARRQQKSASSSKTIKPKPDTVGKAEAETFEVKPLDEPGRETALAELAEFADEDFLADFAKWYTPGDWQWLSERLNKKK